MKKKILLIVLVALMALVAAGCTNKKEEDRKEHIINQTRIMVSDLSNARLDNRPVDMVGKVFENYENKIGLAVWNEWFNVSNPFVAYQLQIVDRLGYVPVGSTIEILNYGEDVDGDGFYFTVVATIDAVTPDGDMKKKEMVFMLYGFTEEGKLDSFALYNQDEGEMQ